MKVMLVRRKIKLSQKNGKTRRRRKGQRATVRQNRTETTFHRSPLNLKSLPNQIKRTANQNPRLILRRGPKRANKEILTRMRVLTQNLVEWSHQILEDK